MTAGEELVTAHDVARALDLSVETIWRYTREHRIPCVRLGERQYRYRLPDVMEALSGAAVCEEKGEYRTTAQECTYDDYLELPKEPGYRYEVLRGMLVREPSPSVMHQRVSRRLQRILEDHLWKHDPEGEVLNAPLDVTLLDETTVVQPDLFYISGEQKDMVMDVRIDGPPTVVVEILSPCTRRKDRLQKLGIYQEAGVEHYWLVDPEQRSMECFHLREGVYAVVATGMDGDVVEHPCFEGLSVDLGDLWE